MLLYKKNALGKLLNLVLFIMFIPFLMLCGWFYYESKIKMTSVVHESLRYTAHNTTQQSIKTYLRSIDESFQRIQSLALRKDSQFNINDRGGPIVNVVHEFLNAHDLFLNAMLYNSDGEFRVIPEHLSKIKTPTDRPWFPHNTREGEIFHTLAYNVLDAEGNESGEKRVAAAMNLFDINRNKIGSVAFDLDMASISLGLKNIQSPYNSSPFVVDRNGTYILHENPRKLLRESVPTHWMPKFHDVSGFFYDDVTEMHVHYSINSNPEWITIITLHNDEFKRIVNSSLNALIFIAISCLIYYVGLALICKLYVANVMMRISYGLDGADVNTQAHDISSIFTKIQNKTAEFNDIETQSRTDPLTGLYNRRKLEEDFTHYIKKNQRIHLAIIDIDNFKSVNDTYGHPVGDKILTYIGSSATEWIREGVSAYRYGGEEFVILFLDMDETQALEYLNQWRQKVSEREWREADLVLTFSCGLACRIDEDLHALVEKADLALYEAKQAGKNRVIVHRESPD
ncbi:MAG TPA: sensor domain-containing diguanylate cyclase [Lelliottia sp.]|jgi:diguanylate cyclase (GGDEF)-like protein